MALEKRRRYNSWRKEQGVTDVSFSSVMLELLCSGVPVIVPAGCWMGELVAEANAQYLEKASRFWKPLVDEAIRLAVLNLSANPCPAGTMDVVLGPGWPGILLHEAIGHGLEGDFNQLNCLREKTLKNPFTASGITKIVASTNLAEQN